MIEGESERFPLFTLSFVAIYFKIKSRNEKKFYKICPWCKPMSKKMLDFRREKSEMKIEEDLILYFLKRNKAIFSMTAEEKEELETRKKRLLYLLVLIFIFAVFLFNSVIVRF